MKVCIDVSERYPDRSITEEVMWHDYIIDLPEEIIARIRAAEIEYKACQLILKKAIGE